MRHHYVRLSAALLALVLSGACAVDARGRGAEGSFSREFNLSGPVQLEVETGSGDIEVRTVESGPVRIDARVRAGWSFWDDDDAAGRVREIEASPPVERSGNTVRVGVGLRWNNVRIHYRISMPRDGRLTARTGSGDVGVEDLQGPVSVQTGSGDIRLGRITGVVRARAGSGDVELDAADGGITVTTGSGDVRVRSARASHTEVSTGSGDVQVSQVAGALRVRTGRGGIDVSGVPGSDWDIGAGSGDISVSIPDGTAFSVDLRASSGGIDAREVTTTARVSRRSLQGTVRGGGPLVAVSTGSGAISVR